MDFREGERTLLCSNNWGNGSPSLQLLDTSSEELSEEEVLRYLAKIIISLSYENACKKSSKNNV